MKFEPHSYQIRGMQLLCGQPGAGLLLDPGMGKTSTVLGAYTALREAMLVDRMLIVAPIRPMYGTWAQECEKWEDFCHLKVTVLHGPKKEDRLWDDADIFVINPEGLQWLWGEHTDGELPTWDVLCIDESTKFKNSQSKRFKLLRKKLDNFQRRWILTGTVTPNGLIDLFSQVYIMDQGLALGKYITHFKRDHFISGGWGGYDLTPREGAVEKVSEKISHMVLRLNAEDHLDMPEVITTDRYIQLPDHALEKYKKVEKDFFLELGSGTITAANAAAAGTKCRQIANGAVYNEEGEWSLIHNKKLEALEELIDEIGFQPSLIVYEFKHDLERLKEYLGEEAVCLTGLSETKIDGVLERFNKGEIRWLLAHAGTLHGLNMHESCHHLVWFSLTWNLESYLQSIGRLYRQNQRATVMCYRILAEETLDPVVANVLSNKESDQEELQNLLMEYANASGR